MKTNRFSENIIKWYDSNMRTLPWRSTNNPYFIWLSEIILQQTRVAQGLPYYERFVESFPNVLELANAPQQDVMRLWQGLGYYSRARNLHQTAQIIAHNYNGVFPTKYAELLKLKGIGPYTAAAIASFAFNEAVAVVDGNVYRVLARVFGIDQDIASPQGQKYFKEIANQLIDKNQPAQYNQAIMEFGALQCVPVSPKCEDCPLKINCVAANTNQVKTLPVKNKKIKVKSRYLNYFVLRFDNQLVLKERKEQDIWQNLFDFYLIESQNHLIENVEQFDDWLNGLSAITTEIKQPAQTFTHILTHQKILASFWEIELSEKPILPDGYQFYSFSEIEILPKPNLLVKYLER